MPGEWNVRPIEFVDVPAALAIQAASPEAAQWTDRDYEPACTKAVYGTVAEGRGALVGFLIARAVTGEIEILNMAVHPAYRRQGVATVLLEDALEYGRTCRATRAFLEVRASNTAAIALYRRHGFVPVGRRPRYYPSPPEDALVLARPLG